MNGTPYKVSTSGRLSRGCRQRNGPLQSFLWHLSRGEPS